MTDTLTLEERLRRLESGGRDHHGLPPMSQTVPLKDPPLSPQAQAKLAHDRQRWQEEQDRRAAQAEADRLEAEAAEQHRNDPEALAADIAELDERIEVTAASLHELSAPVEGASKQTRDERYRGSSILTGQLATLRARREQAAGCLDTLRRRETNASMIQALEVEADEIRAKLRPIADQCRPLQARLAEITREIEELS